MLTKQAPPGQFRVVGRDTPSDPGWLQGDYPTVGEAKGIAEERNGRNCIRFSVYDDQGDCVYKPNEI